MNMDLIPFSPTVVKSSSVFFLHALCSSHILGCETVEFTLEVEECAGNWVMELLTLFQDGL
jgi:hypothetical protein